jgi:acyl-CoA thioester hydrolase
MTKPASPHSHSIPIRVYWEDTDAGGIVYHASHIRFFERGRTEYLRALGVSQSEMAASDTPLFFAVRRMETDYLKPARLDDLLEVTTSTRDIGGARMTLDQVLRRGEETIAGAVVTVVAIGRDGRPHRIPAHLRALFGHPEA